jgi:hypothetical protein
MVENPWNRLPDVPPYVLPEDKGQVLLSNERKGSNHDHFLHVDKILPEPFVGAKDAPVVLLSNNPGFGGADSRKEEQVFKARIRSNLLHEASDWPFVYLDPDWQGIGKEWWLRRIKEVVKRLGGGEKALEIVAGSILNVAFFPYPSKKFGHKSLKLKSQDYSFSLVCAAMRRGGVIVFMRSPKIWERAIPELEKYPMRFQVGNFQNPTITPGNCDGFEVVVEAIKVAETQRRKTCGS